MNAEAKRMIERLGLEPLPEEGGFFRRLWVGEEQNGRPLGTAILFLMTEEGFSALHRLDADEVWYFHAGDPVEHVQLGPELGKQTVAVLGANLLGGHLPQLVAKSGSWQGARLLSRASGAGWSLLGCSMAPGWIEKGFELADRTKLLTTYPDSGRFIRALTR
jgi:predicted cupin superfamily sugar epimerase